MYNTQSKSDWLFSTQSRALQADWLVFENNEKATLNINMTYLITHVAYIYRSAIRSCRPGGVIVYSTCTLTPGQNDYVIEAAFTQLRQLHPDIEIMVQDTSCIRDRLNHVFKFWPGSRYV